MCPARAPPDAGDKWPWPIRLRLFGQFELLLGDAPVEFGHKTPRQPIRLLQAIAVAGPGGLDARAAEQWLWPEGDSAKALSMALLRLRKILGDAGAIELRDGMVLLDRSRIWTDLQQFDVLGDQLLRTELAGLTSRQLEIFADKLFSLCRGPLLADEPPLPWLVAARERYRSRFERLVHKLGQHLESGECWRAALELYARAIENDNLAEEMYRGRIRCHLAMNEPAKALGVYKRCRDLFSILLSAAPSRETEALIRGCGA